MLTGARRELRKKRSKTVPTISIIVHSSDARGARRGAMADSLVDLGLQDALRYIHVNLLPSVVLLVRDVSMLAVTAMTCVRGASPE
jgi:hypothetical protein